MTTIVHKPITLTEFLKLPQTKPASEFINGRIYQKPMPQGKHSRLQFKLCDAVNQVAEERQVALAFPELRCTFGGRSIVPDVTVFSWERIPFDVDGEVENVFEIISIPNRDSYTTANPTSDIITHTLGEDVSHSNENRYNPDWTIEILSPDQKATRVISNILHCLRHGTQLGWFIDPEERSVLAFLPGQQPLEFAREELLPVPEFLKLELNPNQVFGWLKAGK